MSHVAAPRTLAEVRPDGLSVMDHAALLKLGFKAVPARLTRWHLAEAAAMVTMQECLRHADGDRAVAVQLRLEAARMAANPAVVPAHLLGGDVFDLVLAMDPDGSNSRLDHLWDLRHAAGCRMETMEEAVRRLVVQVAFDAAALAKEVPAARDRPVAPEALLATLQTLVADAGHAVHASVEARLVGVTPDALLRVMNGRSCEDPTMWAYALANGIKGCSPLEAWSVARRVGEEAVLALRCAS